MKDNLIKAGLKYTLLTVVFITTASFINKNDLKFELRKKITLVQGQNELVFFITDKKINKAKAKYWYHYYFHRSINKVKGGYLGKLLHGKYVKITSEGRLLESGFFYNGLKDKTWYTWHQNGELSTKENWNRGKPLGEKIEYGNDGLITNKYTWFNNEWRADIESKERKTWIFFRKKTKISDSTRIDSLRFIEELPSNSNTKINPKLKQKGNSNHLLKTDRNLHLDDELKVGKISTKIDTTVNTLNVNKMEEVDLTDTEIIPTKTKNKSSEPVKSKKKVEEKKHTSKISFWRNK